MTPEQIDKYADDFIEHTRTHSFGLWLEGKGILEEHEEAIWNRVNEKLVEGDG